MMAKVYKIEKLEQYGITKITANYVCELLTRTKNNIADLSNSGGLKFNQFPSWVYAMNVYKDIVEKSIALDPSLNINNIMSNVLLVSPFNGMITPYDPSSPQNNPVGVILRIWMFHAASMLGMCHSNITDTSYIEPMKNLSYYTWDNSGVAHSVSFGINLTPNAQLPSILADVPIFQDLWFKLGNTYVVNNGIHLGGSTISLRDTAVGQAVINMYETVYKNIVELNSTPTVGTLMTLNEFYKATYLTEFLSQVLGTDSAYRTRVPGPPGAYGACVLTNDQLVYLAQTTNSINYKLLSELNKLSNGNSNYKFYGTFGNVMGAYGEGIGVTGDLAAFEAASLVMGKNVVFPAEGTCACIPSI